ncbi:uncharacterized protein E0L32_010331 [Thyridium curvatum]|uniref:Uncharacterized protein n=1 Tax=Thyridium curvatum TaxID=1093900 RepID=A0A507AUU2_9PEZI|nr:uncharacterized protein E0L32_010331 [Thyridium curvatum]TPX08000.1 hypothetical protein E0L32_010331 [Thyridium curvatum]
MASSKACIANLLLGAVPALAKLNCPLYGLDYPTPTSLLSAPGVQAAAAALDTVFPQYIDNATGNLSVGAEHFSYSVEVFAASEDKPLWSHYWTAPNLPELNSTGVSKVDGDTVYRLGSVTKVYTVLAFLAEVGDSSWNEPITKYVPELRAMADEARVNGATSHSILTTDWDAITIGALASQMSGLTRDYALLGELTQQATVTNLTYVGFPPIPQAEVPPCGNYFICNRSQFFEGLKRTPPSFAPFVTPTYSDVGYAILAYALEEMAGKSFQSIVENRIIKPLNLTHTFYKTPNDSLGIIPGNRYMTNWAFDMGNESPTGNMYASASDLSTLGRAILRSSLLPEALTRRWLKPAILSSDPKSAVGIPWGAGSLGKYSTVLAVIPDFGIGFSIIAAGDMPSGLTMGLADTLSSTYLPTMQYTAREQANRTYCGSYASSSRTLNSSLSIGVDRQKPGLGLNHWFSNGTDMLRLSVAIGQNVSSDYWEHMEPSVRLYPTGRWDAMPDGGKRVAFKAVFEDLSGPNVTRPFSTDCSTWVYVSGVMYGSKPLDLFIFHMDAAGNVTSVENAALRNRLDKVESS